MIFSPPFLVLALLNSAPSLWAVDATLLAMVFLGGAALMLWFRDQGWHWAGALIAALAFGYGASMAWRIQHIGQVLSLAYLPIAMLCLDRALARRSILYGIAAGLVAACIVLGRDQVALLSVYLLIGLAAWRIATAERPLLMEARACLLPVAGGAIVGLAVIAIPVMLSALLTAESNRAAIDYIGAGRGSLHPALLLTLVAPEVFGASGRMEDYWGPPSYAWPDSGIFLAQNMGQLYIGAIPLILLLMAAARGRLWAREIRFFTVAAVVALLYALGWYTPVFRAFYELLPGVGLFRRPADATFLIGALTAILAGYSAHRLFKDPLAPLTRRLRLYRARRHRRSASRSRSCSATGAAGSPNLVLPLGVAALSFSAGAIVLALARRRIPLQPDAGRRHARGVHDRRPRLQQRPQQLLRAAARACTTCCSPQPPMPPSPCSRARSCRATRGATASSWPALASTGPTPASRTGWRTRWATTRCGSASTVPPSAQRTTSGCPTSASSQPSFPPTARRSPTCWACAGS